MAKILHFSDLHLDSKLSGLGPERIHVRRQEIRETFIRLTDYAVAEGVDIVLIAGDLFNSRNVSPETIELLVETMENSRQLEFFIAPGNHDPYSDRSIYHLRKWPEHVHIFTSTDIQVIELPKLKIKVYGAAFVSEHCTKNLLSDFKAAADEFASILLIHGDLGSAGSDYNPLSKNDIAQSGFDYVALGHIHAFSGIEKAGQTFYAYPGIPEGRGFDECGKKGVIIGHVNKRDVRLHFKSTSIREYHIIELDATGLSDHAVVDRIMTNPIWNNRNMYKVILKGAPNERANFQNIHSVLEEEAFFVKISDERKEDVSVSNGGYAQEIFTGIIQKKISECHDTDACQKLQDALIMGIQVIEGRDIPI